MGWDYLENINTRLAKAFDLFDQGRIEEAEKIYIKCLQRLEENSDSYVTALHGLGYIKASQAQYNEARQIYSEIRQITLDKGNIENEHIAVHQLGMVERMAKNYEKALELFSEEFKLLNREKPGFSAGYAANYYEKGIILLELGEIDRAEDSLLESLVHSKQSDDLISLGCSFRGLGELYQVKQMEKKATLYFLEAIKAFEKANDKEAIKEVNLLMDRF